MLYLDNITSPITCERSKVATYVNKLQELNKKFSVLKFDVFFDENKEKYPEFENTKNQLTKEVSKILNNDLSLEEKSIIEKFYNQTEISRNLENISKKLETASVQIISNELESNKQEFRSSLTLLGNIYNKFNSLKKELSGNSSIKEEKKEEFQSQKKELIKEFNEIKEKMKDSKDSIEYKYFVELNNKIAKCLSEINKALQVNYAKKENSHVIQSLTKLGKKSGDLRNEINSKDLEKNYQQFQDKKNELIKEKQKTLTEIDWGSLYHDDELFKLAEDLKKQINIDIDEIDDKLLMTQVGQFLFLMDKVLGEGINTEGIFRVSGSCKQMEQIEKSLEERPVNQIINGQDIHTKAGVLKRLVKKLFPTFLNQVEFPSCEKGVLFMEEEDIKQLRSIVKKFDPDQFFLLKTLFDGLSKVAANSQQNKMNASSLATCIAPNIIAPNIKDANLFINEMNQINKITRILIEKYTEIFE